MEQSRLALVLIHGSILSTMFATEETINVSHHSNLHQILLLVLLLSLVETKIETMKTWCHRS